MEEPSPIRSLPARYRLASARVLEYRILGPLEVLEDGRPIALAGPKQRAALAILLLSANRVVSIERFADDLYAGAPPVTAVTQVQRQVSELKVIGSTETTRFAFSRRIASTARAFSVHRDGPDGPRRAPPTVRGSGTRARALTLTGSGPVGNR